MLSLKKLDFFSIFLFLYFFTLHADYLHVALGGYSFRLNNLSALLLGLYLFYREKYLAVDRKLCGALLLLGGSLLLSLCTSAFPKRCFFFLGWYVFTALFYLILPYLLMRRLGSRRCLKVYFISFICVGLYAFSQFAFSWIGIADPFARQTFWKGIVRPNAFAYEPSYYALYMTPFVMLVNFHYLRDKAKPFFSFSSLNLFKLLGINFLYLISTSTSALFAYFIFCLLFALYIVLIKEWSLFVPFCKILFGFTVLNVFVFLICPGFMKLFFFKFFFTGFMEHHSFFERWSGIVNGWTLFKEHPFLGVGLGGMPPVLYEAWADGDARFFFPFQDALYYIEGCNPLKFFEPSNVCMELLGSLGLLGFIGFSFPIALFLYRARQVFHVPEVVNFTLSLLTLLIVLQFNQGLFRTYVWTHFALAFAFVEHTIESYHPSLHATVWA